jgi:tRNA(adenine34) deaminase
MQEQDGNNNGDWMAEALAEANKARMIDEVPVGAVIVQEGSIIARAHNLRESSRSPIAHAEILAIEHAAKVLGRWRLYDCVMVVSLEPCCMCAGAMIQARMQGLVYGASDPRHGAAGSVMNIVNNPHLNHRLQAVGGVRREEAAQFLSDFFRQRRAVKKSE